MFNSIFPLAVEPAVHTGDDNIASTNLIAIPFAVAATWVDSEVTWVLVLNN